MTISIEPAKIVGAEIGDRVTWTDDDGQVFGHIAGPSAEYPGRIVVDIEEDHPWEGRRHIAPEELTLAPKRYKVGDKISPEDVDALPDGTTLIDEGYFPLFKMNGEWYAIDTTSSGARRTTPAAVKNRTIAWVPQVFPDPR